MHQKAVAGPIYNIQVTCSTWASHSDHHSELFVRYY